LVTSRYYFSIFTFFFNAPATTETYTLSLHDALPISDGAADRTDCAAVVECGDIARISQRLFHPLGSGHDSRLVLGARERRVVGRDRKSTRLNSSHLVISYAVFCLKKKKKEKKNTLAL